MRFLTRFLSLIVTNSQLGELCELYIEREKKKEKKIRIESLNHLHLKT